MRYEESSFRDEIVAYRTIKLAIEMKNDLIESGNVAIESEKFAIESEKFVIEMEKSVIESEMLAIEMENDCIETIPASYRTAGLHFDRTRGPYRTERGS